MKKILVIIFFCLSLINHAQADNWKVKNKWKVSCGIVDKDSLGGKWKTKNQL